MANRYLLPAYQALFDEEFNYYDFNQRMQMQKAIYLLQDLGVPVGDYSYRWYIHGPYCQELQDDMYEAQHSDREDVKDLSGYQAEIDSLRAVIYAEGRGDYDMGQWLECVGSMRYLRKWVMSSGATEADVLDKLQEKKPHLNDRSANAAAYHCLEVLFA